MKRMMQFGVALLVALYSATAWASDSMFETVRVNERVYALVGDLGQRSPENLGNNITLGFIVGDNGVALVDSGGTYAGAEAIHAAVRKVTDKPIKWVINSGGQDHRWLGNGYFIDTLGVEVIAAAAGRQDMIERTDFQLNMAHRNVGDQFSGTEAVYPTTTFDGEVYELPLEGVHAELIYTGGGHTRADLFVWLPESRTLFAGDIVFADRLLGLQQNMAERWIHSLEYMRDELQPETVIPGHGDVTDLDGALRDSYEYLVFLRESVIKAYDDGAFDPVEAIEGLDQSRFSYLANYDDVRFRSRNALHMAEEMLGLFE